MEVRIPELHEISEHLGRIDRRLEALDEARRLPRWLDLRTLAEVKGIPYDTLKNPPRLQPPVEKAQTVGGAETPAP